MRGILVILIATLTLTSCSKDGATTPDDTPPPQTCNYTLSVTSQTVSAAGGSGSTALTKTAGSCGWTANSDASWLTVLSGTGSDSATLTFSVEANASTDSRTGRITVSWTGGSSQLTVTQSGASAPPAPQACSYSIDRTANVFPAAGGSDQSTVTVTGSNNCSWTAFSNQGFIQITSGFTGTSTGTIMYTVAPNSGAVRFGRIIVTVANATTPTIDIGFTQEAACSLSLDPTTQPVTSAGGSLSTAVTSSCAWTASSDSTWLTISSGASGSGNGSIAYAAAPNASAARTGRITVTAGTVTAQLTVNQDASLIANFTVSPTLCPVAPLPTPTHNQLSCTLDASSSTGVITSYEFRLVNSGGPVLGTSAVVANPTVPCGQGGLSGSGDVSIDVVLTITGPAGSASRTIPVMFRRTNAC